jgi:tetratricopeptide (TPR) repeat protein
VSAETLPATENKTSEAQRLRERAVALIGVNRHQEAVALLHQALAREPDDSYTMSQLASAYDDLGDSGQAMHWVERAISTQPEYAWAHYLRAIFLAKAGKQREASRSISEAVRLAPDNLHYLAYHAIIQLQIRKPRDAAATAARMLNLAPNTATAHTTAARVKITLKLWKEAETHAQTAVSLEPNSAEALALLGTTIMYQRKRQREGLDLIHRAIKLDPHDPVATAALEGAMEDYLPKSAWWEWLLAFANPLSFVLNGGRLMWQAWQRSTRLNALPQELRLFANQPKPRSQRIGLKVLIGLGFFFGIPGLFGALFGSWDYPLVSLVFLAINGGITALACWGVVKLRRGA